MTGTATRQSIRGMIGHGPEQFGREHGHGGEGDGSSIWGTRQKQEGKFRELNTRVVKRHEKDKLGKQGGKFGGRMESLQREKMIYYSKKIKMSIVL